jgi:hypothetical protein
LEKKEEENIDDHDQFSSQMMEKDSIGLETVELKSNLSRLFWKIDEEIELSLLTWRSLVEEPELTDDAGDEDEKARIAEVAARFMAIVIFVVI